MNLADPELEFIDPTPNVHSLFVHFDSVFFWTKLAGKAVVRWSKKMYSCAGVCSYEGRGGICDIALSEPLLKLRPRKDLVETLLHEMIHAYLFVVGKDQDRNGHGPNFKAHMYRINQAAGVNISVYHDFHDEVNLYLTHVWRCNGPCQKIRPYFGIVRRSNNRAPGPSDYWWNTHKRACGGTFIKCKEPEKVAKPVKVPKTTQPKKSASKSNGDITRYIINNNETLKNNNNTPERKSINNLNDTLSTNKSIPKPVVKTVVFSGTGQNIGRSRSSSNSVLETVRNVWANKTILTNAVPKKPAKISASQGNYKRLSDIANTDSSASPMKRTKIDDYFKKTASDILKDVYGTDFVVTQSKNESTLKAVVAKETLVQCPVCNTKVSNDQINLHIDECLNKDVIEKLSKEGILIIEPSNKNDSEYNPAFKTKTHVKQEIKTDKDLIRVKTEQTETHIQIKEEPSGSRDVKIESSLEKYIDLTNTQIKIEPRINKNTAEPFNQPGPSKDIANDTKFSTNGVEETSPSPEIHICLCCNKTINISIQEHLDECLIFFDNDTTTLEDGSNLNRTIVIDDSDDEFNETQTFNATGTKLPCPCCMKMVEGRDMNEHLDMCLEI